VLPACLAAQKIVVYCTGGKCEDSEFAAGTLLEAGIPAAKISVYIGGITEWTAAKLPLETGTRKSGMLKSQ
jgi:rhodanese-related sulfurtransferase